MVREILNSNDQQIKSFLSYIKNEKLYTKDTLINYKNDLMQFREYMKSYQSNIINSDKHNLNLNEINNISDVEIDTYLNKNFFSYRRTTQNRKSDIMKKATGRQVSVIGLK